jgi:polysaccharide biosynthesis protein PslH
MNILFLSPWFPYPPDNGSKIRIYNHIKNLSRKHDVRLITFYRDGDGIDPKSLDDICQLEAMIPFREFNARSWKSIAGFFIPVPRSTVDSYSSKMAQQLKSSITQKRPDLIIASEIWTAIYGGRKWKIPCILDEMQLGLNNQLYTNSRSIASKARKNLYRMKLNIYTKYLLKQYDACTVASEVERKYLAQVAGQPDNIHVIPNGVDLFINQPGLNEPQPNTLIYNGALTFNANFDAMSYFLSEIFPIIQKTTPDVSLKITGRTEGVELSKLPMNDRVIFTGFLPDIRTAVSSAWVCVVPLRYGGGTRLKILEAMALGTPVIATSKAIEGLCVTPGQDILLGDTPEDFATQVIRLLKDKNLREILSKNGRKLVESNYGWNVISSRFESLIEGVMNHKDASIS